MNKVVAGAAAIVLTAAGTLTAQSTTPGVLEGITHLRCSFAISSHGSWSNGEAQAEIKKGSELTVEFAGVDTAEGTANVVGPVSAAHILVQLRRASLHFLGLDGNGSLMVTTVFAQESRDKKLKAVHTRAEYLRMELPGFSAIPNASQYYGECEILT